MFPSHYFSIIHSMIDCLAFLCLIFEAHTGIQEIVFPNTDIASLHIDIVFYDIYRLIKQVFIYCLFSHNKFPVSVLLFLVNSSFCNRRASRQECRSQYLNFSYFTRTRTFCQIFGLGKKLL